MDDQLWEPVNFSGGALCLDFANTLSGWGGPRPRERLNGIGDLLTWTAAAGEIDEREAAALARRAAEAPREGAAVLAEAKDLRAAVRAVFAAIAAGGTPPTDAFDRLNLAVADALGRLSLAPSGEGYALTWRVGQDALRRPLWAVARSAADLLTTADPARLRECGGDDCSWLFLDTSKNARRRWCDMRYCGNRAKAHRHYRRKRETG